MSIWREEIKAKMKMVQDKIIKEPELYEKFRFMSEQERDRLIFYLGYRLASSEFSNDFYDGDIGTYKPIEPTKWLKEF